MKTEKLESLVALHTHTHTHTHTIALNNKKKIDKKKIAIKTMET